MFNSAKELRDIFRAKDSVFFEQLAELLEMQEALDRSIYADKGITLYPEEKVQTALFVELGELMNEFPTMFKYWKDTAEDNRANGLVEFVDCLHFALSLVNCYGVQVVEEYDDIKANTMDWTVSYMLSIFLTPNDLLNDLFTIGKRIGFTWEEIYNAYKEKNAVNYERLKSGY